MNTTPIIVSAEKKLFLTANRISNPPPCGENKPGVTSVSLNSKNNYQYGECKRFGVFFRFGVNVPFLVDLPCRVFQT